MLPSSCFPFPHLDTTLTRWHPAPVNYTGMRALLLSATLALTVSYPPIAGAAETTVVFGGDIDYAPLSYTENGEPVGFDIEFVELVADELSLAVSWRLDEWAEVLEAASTGAIDAVVGIVSTERRREMFAFSRPYLDFEFVIVASAGLSVDSIGDLETMEMAHLVGDAVPDIMLRQKEVSVERSSYPTLSDVVRAVGEGESDFAIVPDNYVHSPVMDRFRSSVTVIDEMDLAATYHIALADQDVIGLGELNAAIGRVLESPEYSELQERWFPHRGELAPGKDANATFLDRILFSLAAIILVAVLLFFFIERRSGS